MTYEEKKADEAYRKFCDAPRSFSDDYFLLQCFQDAIKEATQAQREACDRDYANLRWKLLQEFPRERPEEDPFRAAILNAKVNP